MVSAEQGDALKSFSHDKHENKIYSIDLEVRNEFGKLYPHPRDVGMFTGFKFEQRYANYKAMESQFRLMHEELKMLMPKNKFVITASLYNNISYTFMTMAEFRGEENQFIIFT